MLPLFQKAEKASDDPSLSPPGHKRPYSRREFSSLDYAPANTLNTLFSGHGPGSPNISRKSSYNMAAHAGHTVDSDSSDTSLTAHLYNRGFVDGKYSDITISAFDQKYSLHRIVLDRSPYFSKALGGSWVESSSREVTLHPEKLDPCITQPAFELALRVLYGAGPAPVDDIETNAVGILATGIWLQMQDLVDLGTRLLLHQMVPRRLAFLVDLFSSREYGRDGERLLLSAKAMLCRDGWRMPIRFWDEIPGPIVREIVSDDSFFVGGEFQRWKLSLKLLNRRLKHIAATLGLSPPKSSGSVHPPSVLKPGPLRPETMLDMTPEDDTAGAWIALYGHEDIEQIQLLLDEGIHYAHLSFEQLQYIRRAKDRFGLLVMPSTVLTDTLWMSMELRQKVVNAQETDLELGLIEPMPETSSVETPNTDRRQFGAIGDRQGAQDIPSLTYIKDPSETHEESNRRDLSPRYLVPAQDCNIVIGGNSDPVVTTPPTPRRLANPYANCISGKLGCTRISLSSKHTIGDGTTTHTCTTASQVRCTKFPPFRFSAEFPNPRYLKERERLYSRTVFYAGSYWNVYVQKIRSTKNTQLGIYLHRVKERAGKDPRADNARGTHGVTTDGIAGSVDERIGDLEWEMRQRSTRARNDHNGHVFGIYRVDETSNIVSGSADLLVDDESGPDGTDHDVDFLHARAHQNHDDDSDTDSDTDSLSAALANTYPTANRNNHSNSLPTASPTIPDRSPNDNSPPIDQVRRYLTGEQQTPSPQSLNSSHQQTTSSAALPPYRDTRPTVQTYFKISLPSKAGRLLSIYESAPDTFNLSQSWGWKSSTLVMDDGFSEPLDAEDRILGVVSGSSLSHVSSQAQAEKGGAGSTGAEDARIWRFLGEGRGFDGVSGGLSSGGGGAETRQGYTAGARRRGRDETLKFMVVIGVL